MKSALVVSFSTLSRAPRILRQIEWLGERGWTVDGLGLGDVPPEGVQHLYSAKLQPAIKRYLTYMLKRKRNRYDALFGSSIPKELLEKLGTYDLIVLNELEFAPELALRRLGTSSKPPMLYIDLHENHIATAASNIFERLAFQRYWEWQYQEFRALTSEYEGRLILTSVEGRIAGLYERDLGRSVQIIRNAPSWSELQPSSKASGPLRLVHHGMGTRNRGIEQSIRALRKVPNATLDLFLVAGRFYKLKVRVISRLAGVSARVTLHDPVPTRLIPKAINEFDLASVIIPPATENHLHALPNKFFESIQAGLGVIVGPNPSMASLVSEGRFGLVLENWSTKSLVAALLSVDRDQVQTYKQNAFKASRRFSSLEDQDTFNKILGI